MCTYVCGVCVWGVINFGCTTDGGKTMSDTTVALALIGINSVSPSTRLAGTVKSEVTLLVLRGSDPCYSIL